MTPSGVTYGVVALRSIRSGAWIWPLPPIVEGMIDSGTILLMKTLPMKPWK